jgi:hypothetical protein
MAQRKRKITFENRSIKWEFDELCRFVTNRATQSNADGNMTVCSRRYIVELKFCEPVCEVLSQEGRARFLVRFEKDHLCRFVFLEHRLNRFGANSEERVVNAHFAIRWNDIANLCR